MKVSYRHPQAQPKPNFRATVSGRFTDFVSDVSARPSTIDRSGYTQNSLLFDGTGWVPHRSLHGNQVRTEYRDRYNHHKPFHHTVTPVSPGKMQQRPRVYDVPPIS